MSEEIEPYQFFVGRLKRTIGETFQLNSNDETLVKWMESHPEVSQETVDAFVTKTYDVLRPKVEEKFHVLQLESAINTNKTLEVGYDSSPKWRPKANDVQSNFRSVEMDVLKKYEAEITAKADKSEAKLNELVQRMNEKTELMCALLAKCDKLRERDDLAKVTEAYDELCRTEKDPPI